MRLAEDILRLRNFKLFYDDWFFSIGLAKKLKDEGIHSLSIVRPNRLKGCKLKKKKQLKNEGRVVMIIEWKQKENIMVLRWFNNKSVYILST